MQSETASNTHTSHWGMRQAYAIAFVALVVLAASLFGILTRPVGFLAALWPANALLLGIMVRNRDCATPACWCAAFLAYVAADLLTGSSLDVTLWLTGANMVGVSTGYMLFMLLTPEDRCLRRPLSVLYLLVICVAAALAASVAGGGAARLLFGRDFFAGLEFWFVTELVNSLVILPVILTFPGVPKLSPPAAWPAPSMNMFWRAAPVLALGASAAASTLIGGPGSLAFPVPALIWCALSYGMFSTAALTLALCGWLLVAISAGILQLPMSGDMLASTSSVRLGIALIAIGPLTIASINRARNELMAKLFQAANFDTLTGTMSRGAFMARGERAVANMARDRKPVGLLMIDIDHFKLVNDRYGHAAGDRVLSVVAKALVSTLRREDLLGRIGGEEFSVILPETTLAESLRVAERICVAVRSARLPDLPQCASLSVSIGAEWCAGEDPMSLDRLLAAADRALYAAKASGRDQVIAA